MRLELRVSFRREEVVDCADIEGLASLLHQQGSKPFWLEFDPAVFEQISDLAPRVLRKAHVSRFEFSSDEREASEFFEVLPGKLLRVTDADFDDWRQQCERASITRSPDGFSVKRAQSLRLSSATLGAREIAFPESGEHCMVTTQETRDILQDLRISGLSSRSVSCGRHVDLVTLDPKTVLTSSTNHLSFGASVTESGCRNLDRAAALAINPADASRIESFALLPESRSGCEGTIIVSRKAMELLEKSKISGLRFTPALVIGGSLWTTAKGQWAQMQDRINYL